MLVKQSGRERQRGSMAWKITGGAIVEVEWLDIVCGYPRKHLPFFGNREFTFGRQLNVTGEKKEGEFALGSLCAAILIVLVPAQDLVRSRVSAVAYGNAAHQGCVVNGA